MNWIKFNDVAVNGELFQSIHVSDLIDGYYWIIGIKRDDLLEYSEDPLHPSDYIQIKAFDTRLEALECFNEVFEN